MPITIPTTAAMVAGFREAYRLIDQAGDTVTIKMRQPDGTMQAMAPRRAKVSAYNQTEIVAGSTLKEGDLRCILNAEGLALPRRLEARDRVEWRGRDYAVQRHDDATHSIGATVLAVELQLRG